MKTLNNYINEWKANTNTVSSIEKHDISENKYFVYKPNERGQIKIFDEDWLQFKKYKDKVYINDEHVELDNLGYTKKNMNQEYTMLK